MLVSQLDSVVYACYGQSPFTPHDESVSKIENFSSMVVSFFYFFSLFLGVNRPSGLVLGFVQAPNNGFVFCCSELFAQHVHVLSEYLTDTLSETNVNRFSLSEVNF